MLVVQKLPHLYDFQEVMISTKNGNDRSGEETRRRGVREEEEEEEDKSEEDTREEVHSQSSWTWTIFTFQCLEREQWRWTMENVMLDIHSTAALSGRCFTSSSLKCHHV